MVPTLYVTNPVNLRSSCFMYDIPLLFDSMQYFLISHTIGLTDLLHPSPAKHFNTSHMFLIYLPECQSFSITKLYAPNHVTNFFLKFKSSLLVKFFYLLNAAFAMEI